jgi:hypothetical protein
MHLINISTYPLKSVAETAKLFVEGLKDDPLPEYVKTLAMYAEYGGKGMTVYHIFEIEKGHEDEGLKALAKSYIRFYDIEGFEVTSKAVLTAEESLPMLGLSM